MNTSLKALFFSSLIGLSALSPVMADDDSDNNMPYHPGMMGGGYGMGPGMMNGYGPRAGMHQGYGMGYGMGPGMMQGYGMGYGMGPGMMQGYGMGYGMGPGMMRGYGMGYGSMGPGMMRGYGMGYGGMGPGMMRGYGGMGPGMGYHMNIRFSESQIKQFNKIRSEAMKTQSANMRAMWQERQALGKLLAAENPDKKAIGKAYDKLSEMRKQAFMERIEMQKKMQNVLTKEQKQQMQEYRQSMMGY